MNNIVLHAKGISKSFNDADKRVEVIQDLNCVIESGHSYAIMGKSGSGKSTLLQLLAGLDLADKGNVEIAGRSWHEMSNRRSAIWRNQHLGFVFQFHHLLAEFNAKENVALPAIMSGQSPKQALKQATDMLAKVGLHERVEHRPGALSGGERQRVAIARALINQPTCILLDEPTGNLDKSQADNVMQLLQRLQQEFAMALVIVTHDADIALQQNHQYCLMDGKLVSQVA